MTEIARWMSAVALLQTIGCAFLFLGGVGLLSALGYAWCGAFLVPEFLGVSAHAGGWAFLYHGIGSDPSGRGRLAFNQSLLLVFVGLVAATLTSPWLFVLWLYPYVPSVFGPVVIVHAVVFRAYARDYAGGSADRWIRVGAGVLIALAVVSMAGQAVIGLTGPLWFWGYFGSEGLREIQTWAVFPHPAGLTGIGYVLIFRGWNQLTRADRAAGREPWTDQPGG